ncbi:glycosyltransferase family A protein [Spirillospora sp. NPDC047279]|uniref:glycosyltransferase family A protein n=1 Tax=Spirillospora sp. NPDC047279 TaxID=3155478 RepID=UPI0033FD3DB8
MTTKLIAGLVADAAPPVVATIGLLPEEGPAAERLARAGTVIDLDEIDPADPLEDQESGTFVLVARTSTDLRRAASLAGLLPRAAHIVVGVIRSVRHHPLSLPAVGTEWHTARRFQALRGDKGDWAVEAQFSRPVRAGEFVASLVRGLDGHRPQVWQGPRVALAGAGSALWRPGDPAATLVPVEGPLAEPDQVPPAEVVLRSTAPGAPSWPDDGVPVADRLSTRHSRWAELGAPGAVDARTIVEAYAHRDLVPPVDERSVNPMGFTSAPDLGWAPLRQDGDRWAVEAAPGDVVRFHPAGTVTDADVGRLRRLRGIEIGWGRHTGPVPAVRVVAALAMAGVPVVTDRVPSWARALGPELVDLITGVAPADLADDVRREEHSIRLRRAAFRAHSTRARWEALAGPAAPGTGTSPTASVILCTRRVDYLGFALRQIERQRDVDFEVILTLHGIPADAPEVKAAVMACTRPITLVEVPDEAPLGEALNRGAARASGDHLVKWDDDDWYGPDFLADMLLASAYSGAELVGCFAQLIYLEEIDLTIYRAAGGSERFADVVAGATMTVERSFFESLGGFPPVPRSVDAALLTATRAAGGRTYRTHGLGFIVNRRKQGHTWGVPVTYFLRSATRQWRGFEPTALLEYDAGSMTPDPSHDAAPASAPSNHRVGKT